MTTAGGYYLIGDEIVVSEHQELLALRRARNAPL